MSASLADATPKPSREIRWSCQSFLPSTSVIAACANTSCLAANFDVMAWVLSTRDLKNVNWKPNTRLPDVACPVMYHHSVRKSGWAPRSRGKTKVFRGRACACCINADSGSEAAALPSRSRRLSIRPGPSWPLQCVAALRCSHRSVPAPRLRRNRSANSVRQNHRAATGWSRFRRAPASRAPG